MGLVGTYDNPVADENHPHGFSVFFAGAGIKGGVVHGATDEFGFHAVRDVVHVHDLHATMLKQLGINHEAFSVKFQGLDAKLTGVEPSKGPRRSIITNSCPAPVSASAIIATQPRAHTSAPEAAVPDAMSTTTIATIGMQQISIISP